MENYREKVFYFTVLILGVFLGCGEELGLDIVEDILAEQADIGVPQWRRVSHRDIMLQVPKQSQRLF